MTTTPRSREPFRLFVPILAGGNLRDRTLACLGALIGIGLTGLICGIFYNGDWHLPLLVAPMGASAVLVFAVPASPLAQPWPTIGGNAVSALCGLLVGHLIHEPALAAGVAVAVAIGAMSLLRCLHPPGGAAALVAVFGGTLVESQGFLFPLVPVGLNACLLVAAGIAFHRVTGKAYPHRPAPKPVSHGTQDPPAADRAGFRIEDVDAALDQLGETFDISRDDINRLLKEVETRALVRSYGDLTSADIMSRDLVTVGTGDNPSLARERLIAHDIRALPVLDAGGGVVGQVGFRELETRSGATIGAIIAEPVVAAPETPAIELVGPITEGRTHSILITGPNRELLGLVTQTDLLAGLAKNLAVK